ncbi:uncharacterized protein LOC123556294 [Mercenaria mercenaria]|uniref:uncharacterized protein LOC123556294 n=1 Tax=Mercenaria mercenaria TaxID=6596 RepID=UPI00234F396B|nr:uncharacterized protein LOC123556294 [Mercenaria mercenaria]
MCNSHGILVLIAACAVCVMQANANTQETCCIRPMNKDDVQYLRDYSVMHIFEVQIYNESTDPLRSDVSRTYKPWKWYRTTSEHGKTLLTLSFNFDVLSLSILTIGVERVNLKIKDIPEGCFGNLTAEERVDMLRDKVFDNFKRNRVKKKVPGEEDINAEVNEEPEIIYVCNNIVRDENGYAEFANRCCARDSDGNVTCSEHEDNFWITVLYICIFLVKLMLFMFAPLLVPSNMYTASYVASEYVVKLKNEVKMKVFVSESKTTSVRYKNRLSAEDFSDWYRFKESVAALPLDTICDVKVPELRIKVKGKRIIPANEPPTGLLRTAYDNLIRCKIRGLQPFKDCCSASIYASLQPLIRHKCTWEDLVLIFIKVVMLFLVPFPFYLRTFIYYRFEEEELQQRRDMIHELGFTQRYYPFRMNIVQYLTPTHGLFISAYSMYIICGIIIGFSEDYIKDKLKSIVRSAFHDMQNVSRTSVLQIVLGFLLWPFRKIGLLALLTCPIISALTAPVWCSVFVLYSVPTVYLAYRLIYHSKKKLGSDSSFFESDKPLGKTKQKVYKVHKKLVKIDKNVHIKRATFPDEEKSSPCISGYGRLSALRRFLAQILVSVFCVVVLTATVLLFVEACGVIVEVLVFTMMGIIVNAGATLRYVSMVLLVVVYMHSCYDNVYDNYLTFNGTIIDDVMDRVEDLKKIASLPSSMQENAAFQVKPVEAVDEIPTSLNLEKKEPQWRIGHLLLFFDSFDTPRIPLNLFKKLCEVRVHGAPGPVYINLLKATGKFSIIVIFLFFVMIVVMAFGSANQMSSTNQTLATLAGGFVPMLLKNVLSSKGVKLNLKTLSFKGQIDEIVSEYKQNWPIYDLIVEQYDPKAEEEEKEKENEENKEKDEKGKSDHTEKVAEDEKENEKQNREQSEKKTDTPALSRAGSTLALAMNVPAAGSTLMPPDPFHDSSEDLRPIGVPQNKGPAWFRRLSICPQEDNFVDLFIDLSEQEGVSPWQWMYGSNESVGESITMMNEIDTAEVDKRMPYNQRVNNHMNNNIETL